MIYNVFRGEYPFNDRIGVVDAPESRPDIALQRAIEQNKHKVDHFSKHPVVSPDTPGARSNVRTVVAPAGNIQQDFDRYDNYH